MEHTSSRRLSTAVVAVSSARRLCCTSCALWRALGGDCLYWPHARVVRGSSRSRAACRACASSPRCRRATRKISSATAPTRRRRISRCVLAPPCGAKRTASLRARRFLAQWPEMCNKPLAAVDPEMVRSRGWWNDCGRAPHPWRHAVGHHRAREEPPVEGAPVCTPRARWPRPCARPSVLSRGCCSADNSDHTCSQGLELIPSENFVSASVMEAVGSIMARHALRKRPYIYGLMFAGADQQIQRRLSRRPLLWRQRVH